MCLIFTCIVFTCVVQYVLSLPVLYTPVFCLSASQRTEMRLLVSNTYELGISVLLYKRTVLTSI